jgi:hypothetical protein
MCEKRAFVRIATAAAVAAGLMSGVGGTAAAAFAAVGRPVGIFNDQKSCNTALARRTVDDAAHQRPFVKYTCQNAIGLDGRSRWYLYAG